MALKISLFYWCLIGIAQKVFGNVLWWIMGGIGNYV